MASFKVSYDITSEAEGGYVNDPKDSGGETYCGIARNHHPNWEGWKLVDAMKKVKRTKNRKILSESLKAVPGLSRMVETFYKTEFWDTIKGDQIPNQRLANYVYDFAVNSHPKTAIRYLQGALNFHNKNRFTPLIRDGEMGPKTLAAIEAVASDIDAVSETYLIARKAFLMSLSQENKKKQSFLSGWMNRLELLRKRSDTETIA